VFDDADTRRGQPTVHRLFPEYGEQLALLVGDGLIVLAFENLAWHTRRHPERLAPLTLIIGRAVGVGHGIVAGQAWECETGST
jgi:geranylgeranyl diphosphate synthase type II